MNIDEGLKTPSKGSKAGSTSSPSNASGIVAATTRTSSRKPIKNAKITNFFTKVNSPLNRNSNSNHVSDQSESDNQPHDELSKDASSNSIKVPDTYSGETGAKKRVNNNKEYVFIIPSSDDDTNISTKGSTRRRKASSVHSNNSRSADGLVLTSTNNELGIGPRNRNANNPQQVGDKLETTLELPSPSTPTRSSGRDSRSRDSVPEKRLKTESTPVVQAFNQNSGHKAITRIQPTLLRSRTKVIDFQSVPSDLNMPKDVAFNLIEKLFHVKMPEDFFMFWDFAKTINHRKPCSAFSHAYLEWHLVGPFDVLSGLIADFHGFSRENLLRHCRYYYDPPEFQTVIRKRDSSMTHYGYFRDEPNQEKPIVAQNRAAVGGQIHETGDNLFTLLRSELDSALATLSKSSQEIPTLTFSSSSSKNPRSRVLSNSESNSSKQSQLEKAKAKQELTIIRDKLVDFCSSHENLSCESWSRTQARRARRSSKTMNSIGFVGPKSNNCDATSFLDELDTTEAKLKALLGSISECKDDKTNCCSYKDYIQIISTAKLAVEKGNFNVGLELGLNLFYHGDSFYDQDLKCLLTSAYTRLGRLFFIDILNAHLEERKRGDMVSLLD